MDQNQNPSIDQIWGWGCAYLFQGKYTFKIPTFLHDSKQTKFWQPCLFFFFFGGVRCEGCFPPGLANHQWRRNDSHMWGEGTDPAMGIHPIPASRGCDVYEETKAPHTCCSFTMAWQTSQFSGLWDQDMLLVLQPGHSSGTMKPTAKYFIPRGGIGPGCRLQAHLLPLALTGTIWGQGEFQSAFKGLMLVLINQMASWFAFMFSEG